MIDLFFAIFAAGMNSVDESGGDTAILSAPDSVVMAEPEGVPATLPSIPTVTNPTVNMGSNVNIGSGVVIGGSALLDGTAEQMQPTPEIATIPTLPAPSAQQGFNMAVVPAGLVADPQTPTGKFTTAAEVKPILGATKGNWVAVREYDGKDLVYVTHLWGWRCGLKAMAISLNDEPMQNWPLPECHMKYATPNAILEEDGAPYLSLRLGAVQKVTIQIVYDDLSMEAATFERGNVLIP